MKENQVAKRVKRVYLAPRIEVYPVETESPMLANSPVSGGHHDAEDDEVLNAKQFCLDDNEGIWQNDNSMRED